EARPFRLSSQRFSALVSRQNWFRNLAIRAASNTRVQIVQPVGLYYSDLSRTSFEAIARNPISGLFEICTSVAGAASNVADHRSWSFSMTTKTLPSWWHLIIYQTSIEPVSSSREKVCPQAGMPKAAPVIGRISLAFPLNSTILRLLA